MAACRHAAEPKARANPTGALRHAARGKSSRCAKQEHRRAVTLLEILLVLAVLVLLAAVAWPSLDRSLADQRLRHAADMIRAQWSQAHVRAVSTGTQQRFRAEPGGRRYWIEPAEGHSVPAAPAGSASAELAAAERPPDQRLLPDGVVFDDMGPPLPAMAGAQGSVEGAGPEVRTVLGFMQPEGIVMFYPDGTCTSARLVLRNAYDRCLAVSLQGLTGVATVGDVFPAEEPQP